MSYVLFYIWTGILVCMTLVTLIFTLFWGLCVDNQRRLDRPCIDFTQFGIYFIYNWTIINIYLFSYYLLFYLPTDWMFPNGTKVEDLQVCGPEELKMFCKDYVEVAEVSFILSTVSSFVVSLALVHYLMCLASNYAYIRDQEKISDLQEMQYLHESIMK